jgi:hypothetical protein
MLLSMAITISTAIRTAARKLIALMPLLLLSAPPATAQHDLRFGVLGLFHPKELLLEPENRRVLSVAAEGIASNANHILNGESGRREIIFRAVGDRVVVGSRPASSWSVAARDGSAVAFRLTVPGKIHRVYWGRLTMLAHHGELAAVVAMDRETAVTSIVAAEMMESASIEALEAQAVATRSFLAAGARHDDFDFCDTTHCQFLKSPPPSGSRVARAVQATQGLVLAYSDKPLAAMYSRRCGGKTRSLRDAGMEPGDAYPYFSVPCAWCRKHSFTWKSRIGSNAHTPQPGNESKRIAQARQWGWSAIPGSDFTASAESDGWHLEGHSLGHGVGMCQFGATGMALAGANFREILSHYYPNTTLISQP